MSDRELEFHNPSSEEKMLAVLCHLSCFIGVPFLLPLIMYLIKRDSSPFVASHAKESLNAAISYLCWALLCIPLCFILIGIPMLIAVGILGAIAAIIATVKTFDNVPYRYPMIFRLV
jgi:uncharacterized protein